MGSGRARGGHRNGGALVRADELATIIEALANAAFAVVAPFAVFVIVRTYLLHRRMRDARSEHVVTLAVLGASFLLLAAVPIGGVASWAVFAWIVLVFVRAQWLWRKIRSV